MKTYIPITLESEPSIIGVDNGVYQCEIKPKKFNDKDLKVFMTVTHLMRQITDGLKRTSKLSIASY